MQSLGGSWDVVEVVRALVTEVDSLQKISASHEARLQVLEHGPRPLITVGDLVAESDPSGVAVAAPKVARAGKK